MISAVIIDDEQNNIDGLRNLVEKYCPGIFIIGSALDANAGYDLIRKLNPQLVFLDVELPFGNGFDLLERLRPLEFDVIFVTAFDQYAIRAFKYAVVDYLLKPVCIDELQRAVESVKKRINEKVFNNRIEELVDQYRNGTRELKKIGLPSVDGIVFEEIENIIRIEAEGNYTSVHINGKKKELITKSLKEFEEILPPSIFCRVHHSHIVNLNYVRKYYRGRGGYLELKDGAMVEVSSRKKDEFLEKFKI